MESRVSSFPPQLIARYLCTEFLRFFTLCLLLFLVLSLLVDFFDRFHTFVKHQAPPGAVVRYFLFKLPLYVWQAVPASALAGSLLSLGILSRHKELLALKACGVDPWQIAVPLLCAAGVLSVAGWTWNEKVVPYAYQTSRTIHAVDIKKKPQTRFFRTQGFWYHGANGFYHINHFDSRHNVLSGLTVYRLGADFQIRSVVRAARATWNDGRWRYEGLEENELQASANPASGSASVLLSETPEDFSLATQKAEELSSDALRAYIENLQQKGLDTTEYQVDLRLKAAVPFAAFVMTLIGAALAVPGSRQLALPAAVGAALVVGFGYWVLLAFTVALGHGGVLHPTVSAWLANGTAGAIGMYFLLGID